MPVASPCLERDLLTRYLTGQVSAIEAAMVERHLEDCERCIEAMTELDSHGTMFVGVDRAFSGNESDINRVVERAREVCAEALTETVLYSSPVPSKDEFLALLRQSEILSEEQLAAACEPAPPDVETLIARLLAKDWVTPWQVQELASGRSKLTLGSYRLVDKLGSGGMGTVYLAEHTSMRRLVALKVVSDRRAEDSSAAVRFRREVQALAKLDHPNLIRAYDAGWEGEVQFLVMEYVAGNDLSSWIERGTPMSLEFCCECIRQAALGLHHAHERGIVHRDIKPSNLLLTGDEPFTNPVLKILDLGLARFSDPLPDETSLTGKFEVMGTPDYISPEQARSSREADARSDIYSLGCTLYHMLTGQKPFTGETPLDKIMGRIGQAATPVHQVRPTIPVPLGEVVARMMAPAIEERYQSAAAVADALAPFSNQVDPPPPESKVQPTHTTETLSGDASVWTVSSLNLADEAARRRVPPQVFEQPSPVLQTPLPPQPPAQQPAPAPQPVPTPLPPPALHQTPAPQPMPILELPPAPPQPEIPTPPRWIWTVVGLFAVLVIVAALLQSCHSDADAATHSPQNEVEFTSLADSPRR